MSKHRTLVIAGWVFAAGSAIHMVDHLRRGQGSITETLSRLGTLSTILQAITVTLIVARHRLAPVAAVAAGFSLAAGFLAAHWLPDWSSLSDPLWQIESMRWLSVVASSAEILGALAIGIAGLRVLREDGWASVAPLADESGGRRSSDRHDDDEGRYDHARPRTGGLADGRVDRQHA
jgi:hypothetical protein